MADTTTHLITAIRFIDSRKGEFSGDFERAFYLGSQGPDIFFFGMTDESFVFGDSLHDSAPKELFEIDGHGILNETELYKGYYFGVMLHYFLDRIIHQYVGYRRRTFPEPYSHTLTETSIDMIVTKREFGYPPSKFPYDKYFKKDDDLIKEVFRFYKKRREDEILTESYVEKCVGNFIRFTKSFMKPSPLFRLFVRILERKKNAKGSYRCHLKIKENYRPEVMNDEKKPWQGKSEIFTLSVGEMLDKALADFDAEIKKVRENEKYVFEHTEEFSCNK